MHDLIKAQIMKFGALLFFAFLSLFAHLALSEAPFTKNRNVPAERAESITLICLMDGSIAGVETENGNIRWTISTEPLVSNKKHGDGQKMLFIPDSDGSLYTLDPEGMILKLPYTVQELVMASPFHSGDGHIFLGKKKSRILSIDPNTGEMDEFKAYHSILANHQNLSAGLFIGRADYTVSVYTSSSDTMISSVTFSEYTTAGIDYAEFYEGWANKYHDYFVTAVNDGKSVSCTTTSGGMTVWTLYFPSAVAAIFSPDRIILYPPKETPLPGPDLTSLRYDRYYTLKDYLTQPKYPTLPTGREENHQQNGTSRNRTVITIPGPTIHWLVQYSMAVFWGAIIATAMLLLIFLFYMLRTRKNDAKKSEKGGENTPYDSNSSNEGSKNANEAVKKIYNEDGYRAMGILRISRNVIGYGSSGTMVFDGYLEDGREVAIKRMISNLYEEANSEISILLEADSHPNVVRYFVREDEEEFVYLALEKCKCNLRTHVESDSYVYKGEEAELEIKSKFRRLLDGLSFLHSLQVVHRDLKPENILISKSGDEWKISDMGFAKKLTEGRVSYDTKMIGSQGWQSPEVLLGLRATKKVDVFSSGCLLFFALTGGSHPFGERLEIDHNITLGSRVNLESADIDNLARDLVEKMTLQDADKRYDIQDCIEHPYFWKSTERLKFLQILSDTLEFSCFNKAILAELRKKMAKKDMQEMSELQKAYAMFPKDYKKCTVPQRLVIRLEGNSKSILKSCNGDWLQAIDSELVEDLIKFRKSNYNGTSVCSLLRVIRNKSLHYPQLTPSLKSRLFQNDEENGVWNYFNSIFPQLFMSIYNCSRKILGECAAEKLDSSDLDAIFNKILKS